MRLTNTKARELNFIRALLHGSSGIGKTTSLRTLPADKTVILAAERGLLPLRHDNYAVMQIESWPDLQLAYSWLMKPETIEDKAMKEAVLRCKIVAVDSLTEVAALCARHIVTVDRPRLTGERTGGKRETPEKTYEDQLTMEDWGLYRARLTNLVAALVHLPYHIVVTSLTSWTEDKVTGAQYKTPALSGKFAMEVGAHFDEVLYMDSVNAADGSNSRRFQTYNDGCVIAKDASGVLLQYEEPHWGKVFGKILTTNGKDK